MSGASFEKLGNDPYLNDFWMQRAESLEVRAEYVVFEQGEGGEWPRSKLILGGIGNARELSLGLSTGKEERIREGYGDVMWTAHVLAGAYDIEPSSLAAKYVAAQEESYDGISLTDVRVNLLEGICGLPRYGEALDGRRTLPSALQEFEKCLDIIVYNTSLAIPIANREYYLSIDPTQSFANHIANLSIRVALQILYGQLRDRLISPTEAQQLATDLKSYASSRGISDKDIAEIWRKAPTRVRGLGRGAILLS